MLAEDDVLFNQTTGEVRIKNALGSPLVLRIKPQGVGVWDKVERRERTIPWMLFTKWAVRMVCAAARS